MEWIRRIADLTRGDLPVAGGKGAQLGELIMAGLPVPPGFVLLTPAYRAFVELGRLEPEIERLAGDVRPEDVVSVEHASEAIRALFDACPIPSEIAALVTNAYREICRDAGQEGDMPVAVRSSATAEDMPGASYAGQQESYLNIRGEAAVLEAVRRCWSSLWTPRAISYRAWQGIPLDEVALAVVVQQLIPAETAGVLFTANPVNGRRDQTVINATWGLGEALVSGIIIPDQWVADSRSGSVLDVRTARKTVMTARTDQGTATLPVPPELQERPTLTEAKVAALVALGSRAVEHFGAPQDIEWAEAGGKLYLVQSRPITSLFPLPEPLVPPELGLRVYVCFNLIQGIVEPLTPAGISYFRYAARGFARLVGLKLPPNDIPAMKVAASRIYMDLTNMVRHRVMRKAALTIPAMIERPMVEALKSLLEREPRLAPDRPLPFSIPFGSLSLLLLRALLALVSPDRRRDRAVARMDRALADLVHEAEGISGVERRMAFLKQVALRMFPNLFRSVIPPLFAGMACRHLAERLLTDWLGDAGGMQPTLRSLPHNPTTEMDLALWRLSRRLKAEGAEPSASHPGVREFLVKYGHRAIREIDAGMARWNEDPGHILNVLRIYLSHGEEHDPEAHFRQGAAEAEAAVAELLARVTERKGRLRAHLLGFLLGRMRKLIGIREYPKFFAIKSIAVGRRVIWGLGDDLVEADRLDRADDVFFVDLRHVENGGDLFAEAARNRAEYNREMSRRQVPRVLTSEGETLYGPAARTAGALTGTSASAGVYEGKARVILDPKGAALEPGEVLVAPGTDPAWTPLFFTAGALVMEVGGTMSHGSVVAREYGIPAVVGVAGATQRLRTGQRIRVDGETGEVIELD